MQQIVGYVNSAIGIIASFGFLLALFTFERKSEIDVGASKVLASKSASDIFRVVFELPSEVRYEHSGVFDVYPSKKMEIKTVAFLLSGDKRCIYRNNRKSTRMRIRESYFPGMRIQIDFSIKRGLKLDLSMPEKVRLSITSSVGARGPFDFLRAAFKKRCIVNIHLNSSELF